MAMTLGENKVLKEIRVEINDRFQIRGHMNLVDERRIILCGTLKHLNDKRLENFSQFPIIIQYKLKNPLNKNDNVWKNSYSANEPETAIEYLKYFSGDSQKLHSLQLYYRLGSIEINAESKTQGSWRAGHIDPKEYEILEAKNVPGLKDIKQSAEVDRHEK